MICCHDTFFLIVTTFFLLLTFLVGCYFSRKKTSFRQYAIGNKEFDTTTLTTTVLATIYGGGALIRGVESIYEDGLYWVIIVALSPLGCLIVSKLALRMGPFMGHLSIAETIGTIYGKYPRIVAALVGIATSIFTITIQIKAINQAFSICLTAIDPTILTISTILLLIFYSAFGGIRGITFTNLLQFLTFFIVIPLLSWIILFKMGKSLTAILSILQSHTKFQFSNVIHFDSKILNKVLLLLSLIIAYTEPMIIQRVYMSSDPIQARKVFLNATFLNVLISFFIILTSLFAFVMAPDLPKKGVWGYLIANLPIGFKFFLSIGVLAMAISTTDASLNCCSVMISHDILRYVRKKKAISDTVQLKVARWTTLFGGLLSTLLACSSINFLELMYGFIGCILPILPAPFILALFGFRGTSRTALIGMVSGIGTILIWNQCIKPLVEVDGAFFAMLANGLSMMAAHYCFKQPVNTRWVEPDNTFKQVQQARGRRFTEYKELINRFFTNRRIIFDRVIPSNGTIISAGVYFTIFNLLSHFLYPSKHHRFWFAMQLLLGAYFVGYPFLYHVWQKMRAAQRSIVGIIWLLALVVYLPFNLIWHLLQYFNPIFTAGLAFAHCILILSLLPIYFGVVVVMITLLVAIYFISIQCSYEVLFSLLPLFVFSILISFMVIYLKIKISNYANQIIYLKNQEKIRATQAIKSALYESEMVPFNHAISYKGYGVVLKQVVHKVEQSIAFLDKDQPLFKEDFQTIINKLYEWIDFFKRKEQAKHHALLNTNKISLDKLIRKLESALSQQTTDPPRIFIEKIRNGDKKLLNSIICDVNQITYAVTKAILRIAKLENKKSPIIRIQFHPTAFQFKQADNLDNSYPDSVSFQGTAMLISSAQGDVDDLPKVKSVYSDLIDTIGIDTQVESRKPRSIDLDSDTLSSVVRAHYGYLEAFLDKKTPAILLVLPVDVTHILDMINVELPLDTLTKETTVTLKEEADAMVVLMKFHDDFCQYLNEESPDDLKMISASILLLRRYFRFKRHNSGQLFYVRAIGIAQLVAEWAFNYHKVICAALLYELVRHNCLPLSYIKKNYNIGIYGFVSNLVKIDAQQDLEHSSLLYIQNRFEKAIKENNVQISVLCIKLAERLYDLRHAKYYNNPKEIAYMAQETLAIDVQIADRYLDTKIGIALEKAAKEALKITRINK